MCTKQRSDHLPLSFFLTRALTLLWPALFLTTHPFFLLAFFFSSGRGCGRKNLGTGHFLDQHFLVLFLYHAPFLSKKKGLAKGRVYGQKNRWSEKELAKERVCGQENGLAKEMVDKKKNWWTKEWWTEKRIGGHGIGGHAAATEVAEMGLG